MTSMDVRADYECLSVAIAQLLELIVLEYNTSLLRGLIPITPIDDFVLKERDRFDQSVLPDVLR